MFKITYVGVKDLRKQIEKGSYNEEKKPINRNIRCLYKALLVDGGDRLSLENIVSFYEEYDKLRVRIKGSPWPN